MDELAKEPFAPQMEELINIPHPFLTVEDFRHRMGGKLAGMMHRLAGKYSQLMKSCGAKRMLVALSVAWGLTSAARAGNQEVFEHIDEAFSPCATASYVLAPPWGCVTVEGQPFYIGDHERAMERFIWDGFTIFIDHEGIEAVNQMFFDFADRHQSKAYVVMNEYFREERNGTLGKNATSENAAPKKIASENAIEKKVIASENAIEKKIIASENAIEKKVIASENTIEKKVVTSENAAENREKKKRRDEDSNAKRTNEKPTENKETPTKRNVPSANEEEFPFVSELVDEVIRGGDGEKAKWMLEVMEPLCHKVDEVARPLVIEQTERLEYWLERQREAAFVHEGMATASINQWKGKEDIINLLNKKGILNMGDTYHIQGDFVKGDKVMGNKYVGYRQDSEEEERLKAALETLLEEVDADGKKLFQTQAQWFAVYRILSDEYGWRNNALSEFCRRINQLGLRLDIACKLEGIKKVNQTAPFYKAFSEWEPMGNKTAYDRQVKVASRFKELMEEVEA